MVLMTGSLFFCYLGMSVLNRKLVNVRLSDDQETTWIVGSCFLPDGRLLLSDFNNHKVKLLDSQFNIEDSIKFKKPLEFSPHKENTR